MSIEVRVDRDRCVGSGNCEFWAPAVLRVGDDGIATVIGDPSEHLDAVEAAGQNCPTRAIEMQASD